MRALSALALASWVGCGGRSVEHVGPDDAGADSTQTSDADPASGGALESCVSVCQTCLGAGTSGQCEDTCGQVAAAAGVAGCTGALTKLLDCRARTQSCDVNACPRENNNLSVCVIPYCDGHPTSALCTEPL